MIGITPFWLLYGISNIVRFILEHIIRYRKQVITNNLILSFPKKSSKQIKKTRHLFYKNLSDILIEGVKGHSMSNKQITERHKLLNPELINSYLDKGQTIITAPCHYNNWEWGTMSLALFYNCPTYALYKPLSNKLIDNYVSKGRAKAGSIMVPIEKTGRTFYHNQNTTVAYAMASDQCPSNIKKAHWVNFLGRKTAFIHGLELYSKKFNLPLFFIDIQRVKRGYYELTCSLITDNPTKLKEGEITALYAKKLEESIIKTPENWLWSHKRWKHKYNI